MPPVLSSPGTAALARCNFPQRQARTKDAPDALTRLHPARARNRRFRPAHWRLRCILWLPWLLGGLGGTVIAIIACRVAGPPGAAGIGRGFGTAIGIVTAVIITLGTVAWEMRKQRTAGRRLAHKRRSRASPGHGTTGPEAPEGTPCYAAPHSGYGTPKAPSPFRFDEARLEGGATPPIHVSEGRRALSALLPDGATQYFDTPIPARPAALDADWSAWLPFYSGRRIVPRRHGRLCNPLPHRAAPLRTAAPAACAPPEPPSVPHPLRMRPPRRGWQSSLSHGPTSSGAMRPSPSPVAPTSPPSSRTDRRHAPDRRARCHGPRGRNAAAVGGGRGRGLNASGRLGAACCRHRPNRRRPTRPSL